MLKVQQQLADLPLEVQAELCRHWEMVARLEHSSVASFARVVLELMALGAPADLLLDTQSAAYDEVIHAQLALDVVSALRGEQVSFGPFPADQLSLRTDRDEILVSLIEEACLGEVLGVVEAGEELAMMQSEGGPEVLCERLTRVITDESRHAALAWRTFAWLLDGDQPSSVERARRCDLALHTLLSATVRLINVDVEHEMALEQVASLNAVGLLSRSARTELRLQGLREVIIPGVFALLGEDYAHPLTRLAHHLGRKLA
jgi:hypothetical protein